MTINKIVEKFKSYPKYMTYGAGKMSKAWKCSKEDIYEARRIVRAGNYKPNKLPKILVFDIETAPIKAWVWRRWQQNVYPDQVISDWFMLTWSAKWLYSGEVMNAKLTPQETFKENDKRITKKLWKLFDEADMVVAHNGDKFDIPIMNSRFLVNGLMPPSHYKQIDTKKVASRTFGFSSNKLNELGKYLGLGVKLDTDFDLWKRCLEGDESAMNYMQKYNDQDVILLEEVYLALRPFIKSHPNVGVYLDTTEPSCAHCGSKKLIENGFYYTNTAKYNQFRCTSCGGQSRGRTNILSKDKKKSMNTSIPR